jgi:dTDP-4-dehydrorhamnose reductase
MNVFVVGHHGMLGHVVARYLAERGHRVQTSDARYHGDPSDPLIGQIVDSDCPWIINAMGRIKQKTNQPDQLFAANTLFPIHLRLRLRPTQRLIHASTDCVFSGRQGSYAVDAPRDAQDHYGLSKALSEIIAEPGRCLVIRTSIIGPEPATGFGLMAWFLSQDQGEVRGFIDHLWNGITTLEWAKVCNEILHGDIDPAQPIVQPGVEPPLSKCELLRLISQIWKRPIAIRPVASGTTIDRSLRPTHLRPSIDRQLRDLKAWYPFDSLPCR